MDEIINQVHHTDSNHVGMFNMDFEIQKDRWLMASLMSLCVVIEAYPHESGRGTTFVAISEELFQPLNPGDEIPQYRLEFDHPAKPLKNRDPRERFVKSLNGFEWRAVRNNIVRVPPAQFHMHTPKAKLH